MQDQTPGWRSRLASLRLTPDRLRPYPALPLLGWLLLGAFPLSAAQLGVFTPAQALLAALLLALVLLVCLPLPRRSHLAALAVGLAAALLQAWAPWRTYDHLLHGRDAHVEVEAVVIADRLPEHDELAGLVDDRLVPVALRRLRFSPAGPWTGCRGTVALIRPGQPLRYGQTLLVTGELMRPYPTRLPGGFDYRRTLRIQGIHHFLYPDTLTVAVDHPTGWRRAAAWLYACREAALLRLLRYQTDPDNRLVLAAMTLGFRQGMTPAQRLIYLRSGMIHLFAISGLHVGVLFSVILTALLLARVPFTIRYWLAPVLLLIYVLATGAAPSAVRAWLMLTIWAVGRGLKLPVVPINAVLIAALILLAIDPYYLYQTGFQFSFIIVLALLWGWNQARWLIRYHRERHAWKPADHRLHVWIATWFRHRGWQALGSMTAAWLGGIGLTALYNQLFLPAAIFTNIVVFLLAGAIIWLASIKLVLSFIVPAFLERLLSAILGWALSAVHGIAGLASAHGGVCHVQVPPVWMVPVFYLLLVALFLARNRLRRAFLTGAVLACWTLLMLTLGRSPTPAPRVDVILPAAETMPIVIIRPALEPQRPILLNVGDQWASPVVAEWLRRHGVDDVSEIVFLDNLQSCHGGLERFLQTTRAGTVYLLAPNRRNETRLAALVNHAHGQWRYLPRDTGLTSGPLQITVHKTAEYFLSTVRWAEPDTPWLELQLELHPTTGDLIRLRTQSHPDWQTIPIRRASQWRYIPPPD